MKFDLVRPCAHCPFRSDIRPFLTQERAAEIARALLSDQTFSCHETVDYDAMEADEDGETRYVTGKDEQHCAGAMIVLERQGKANQMMRWMERLRDKAGKPYYDARRLDMNAPVYPTFRAFVDAQEGRAKPEVTARIEKIR